MKRIVWAITGAGDLLIEITNQIQKLSETGRIEATTCLSKAGYSVLRWYKLQDRVEKISKKVHVEQDANTPFIVGPLQTGRYHSLLVAPATGNTVAKIAHGIADTLITNAVAQTQKGGVPVYILPVDQKMGEIITYLPSGEQKKLVMREIDIENVKKLKSMKRITVLEAPQDITRVYLGSE
ncbi:archaeoflavoprotein AfpA [Candidatus Bathyarchaeota archaeon]|nr:archaeoflavoprotein AfpA [Candidatus Bathyarchaeota archaeon]